MVAGNAGVLLDLSDDAVVSWAVCRGVESVRSDLDVRVMPRSGVRPAEPDVVGHFPSEPGAASSADTSLDAHCATLPLRLWQASFAASPTPVFTSSCTATEIAVAVREPIVSGSGIKVSSVERSPKYYPGILARAMT